MNVQYNMKGVFGGTDDLAYFSIKTCVALQGSLIDSPLKIRDCNEYLQQCLYRELA